MSAEDDRGSRNKIKVAFSIMVWDEDTPFEENETNDGYLRLLENQYTYQRIRQIAQEVLTPEKVEKLLKVIAVREEKKRQVDIEAAGLSNKLGDVLYKYILGYKGPLSVEEVVTRAHDMLGEAIGKVFSDPQ